MYRTNRITILPPRTPWYRLIWAYFRGTFRKIEKRKDKIKMKELADRYDGKSIKETCSLIDIEIEDIERKLAKLNKDLEDLNNEDEILYGHFTSPKARPISLPLTPKPNKIPE